MCPQTLSVREWTCPDCGSIHDRDVNAAINLKKVAESSAGGCQPFQRQADCSVTACGEVGSGLGHAQDETGLCEAGSQLHSCVSRNE
ncbi:zinc ribbon domain-containing protein [Thermochromatium tepidum]|uniref:zinc ribbon domain-containing protein n=1 Tax=Thermochromatium tepidum TaxID=1050 RepID=UPI001B874B21